MKNKLIELLTTKFGVGAKVVEGIAEKLSKTITTEEEAATAVEGVSFQQVLEGYADKRANEASETARKNAINAYEKQYGLKDGKTIEDPAKAAEEAARKAAEEEAARQAAAAAAAGGHQTKPTTTSKPEDEVPQYIKDIQAANKALQEQNAAMLKSLEALQGKVTGMETQKLTESRQSILTKTIEKLSAAQKTPYTRIALDSMSDEDFNSFIEETKNNVAAIEKDNAAAAAAAGNGRPFVGNMNVDGKKASSDEIDAVVGKIM